MVVIAPNERCERKNSHQYVHGGVAIGGRCDGQCREAIVVELVAPLDTKVVRAWLGDASIVVCAVSTSPGAVKAVEAQRSKFANTIPSQRMRAIPSGWSASSRRVSSS